MKSINSILVFASFLLIGTASCDKGRVCECTTTDANGVAASPIQYPTLDNTENPDCTGYEGTDSTNAVTTCIKVKP